MWSGRFLLLDHVGFLLRHESDFQLRGSMRLSRWTGNSTGDCCKPNGTFGCTTGACELCVCEIDSFCCTDVWDANCVEWASIECIDSCGCDPIITDEGGEEGPEPEPGTGCQITEAVGALDATCEACVCDCPELLQ